MQKGQISIDLLFTIVAAVLIVVSFNGLVNSTYMSQDRISTKQQLDLENQKLTNLITQTQIIDDYNYQIITTLEKINYLDQNKNQVKEYPIASVSNNILKLSINNGTEVIESQKPFYKNANTTIKIGKDENAGTIVILHE